MENTSTSAVTPTSVGIRYGVLIGIASIIFSMVLFMTNADQSPARWLGLIIIIGGIYLAHGFFKRNNAGFMSYGQGLGIGVIVSAVAGLLSGIFNYIYVSFIDPTYMERIMEATRAKMEEGGNMSDEQIDQAIAMSQKFSSGPISILFAILGSILIGLILSLIISAITKHSRPEFE